MKRLTRTSFFAVTCSALTLLPISSFATSVTPDQVEQLMQSQNQSQSIAQARLYLLNSQLDHLKAQAKKGDSNAMYLLGEYFSFQSSDEAQRQAQQWYLDAAKKEHSPAQYALGSLYASHQNPSRNFSEAVKWYQKAVKHGHAGAMFALSGLYRAGFGVKADTEYANQLLQQAAFNGNALAQVSLANAYQAGSYGFAKDDKKARALYQIAALDHQATAAQKQLNELSQSPED